MNKIGIVTVTFNSSSVLNEFMQSCLKQSYHNFILYVIDSGSSDNTLDLLKVYTDKRIVVIDTGYNIGFAAGSNRGIQRAFTDGCDYICLLNNDTVFNSNLFSILLSNLELANVDMAAPKMMYHEPYNKIWYAGGEFKKRHEYKVIHYGENEIDIGQYDNPGFCEFAPMCCVLFKKECFDRIGLLDEKFFVYSEDADWFLRAKRAGLKLLYIPQAVLLHKVSSLTEGPRSKFSAMFGTRNKVYFIRKNFRGLKRVTYITEYFLWIFVGLLTRKFTFTEFKWKIPAFFRGVFY